MTVEVLRTLKTKVKGTVLEQPCYTAGRRGEEVEEDDEEGDEESYSL